MKTNVIGNGAVVVAICAAIILPLVVRHNADIEARATNDTLRQQKDAIEELSMANAKRKQELGARNADGLTDEQMRELLRLRAEAGGLRRQSNQLERLRAENQSLESNSGAEPSLAADEKAKRARELSRQLLDAADRLVAALPEVERRFREKEGTAPPLNFPDLRDYFPAVNGKRMPGLYSFTFIRVGGPKPGDNLVLLETATHETADGKIARIYALANGHAEEVVAPDRENADAFFLAWTRENWGTAGDPPTE